MANFTPNDLRRTMHGLRWPLRLTRMGMFAETVARSFWPLMTVCLLCLAALMLGLHELPYIEVVWAAAVVVALLVVLSIYYAVRHFRWPTRADAMARLDNSLAGRPITALLDAQIIGSGDDASAAVWRAHKAQMAGKVAAAKAVAGDLKVSRWDPFALRYVAILAFAVALIFGSFLRVGSVTDLAPGGDALATGPVWEGWAEAPRYTGLPTLYLNDLDAGALELPAGTLITLRLYGEVGALQVTETVSGRETTQDATPTLAFDFTLRQPGQIEVIGPGGRAWDIAMKPDTPPEVIILGQPHVSANGEMRLPFAAKDDYGVEAGEARIALNLEAVDRVFGLRTAPDPRADIVVPLPMPIAGQRVAFEENLIDDFSEHAWANMPVTLTLNALDAAEQAAKPATLEMTLPGRRFFDPMAAAVIEMRRDLLWSRSNGTDVAMVLRAVSYLPEDVFRSQTSALRLKTIIGRLETHVSLGLEETPQGALAQSLWDLALELEEGDLDDARERMRRAKERLEEAMKNGATDEEIAELMQELRRATEEYMQQLQRQQAEQRDGAPQPQQPPGETMQMTQDDLQKMMDHIQELMEQGRMAEAEQALQELQEMMENMQVTEGQQGEGGQSPGEQAMEGLADTLREQQGLSDQAFRDLQEQYNPGAQAGESQGNEGRNGGQGQGQSHEGQEGQGEGSQGQNGAQGQDQRSLAERQQALRDELSRQEGQLPGGGTAEGDAAREALNRAGRAMNDAEQALRNNDLAEAIDNQSQAMEALREGMRSLGEAMAQNQNDQRPGQGTAESDRRSQNRDPLGREQGTNGATGTDSELAQNPDAGARARELLDEIRRRSGETARPELERDYLKRLLDQF